LELLNSRFVWRVFCRLSVFSWYFVGVPFSAGILFAFPFSAGILLAFSFLFAFVCVQCSVGILFAFSFLLGFCWLSVFC